MDEQSFEHFKPKDEKIIGKENKVEKEPKPIALYIDDYEPNIKLIKCAFDGDNRILAVQCFSTEQALKAIRENGPSILFIDNSLSGNGNEGLEVVDQIKKDNKLNNIKIISTTGSLSIVPEYEKRGIERLESKTDFTKIESIINDFESKHKKINE